MASADQWPAHAIRLDAEALLGPPWDLRSNDVMQAVREVKTSPTLSSIQQLHQPRFFAALLAPSAVLLQCGHRRALTPTSSDALA